MPPLPGPFGNMNIHQQSSSTTTSTTSTSTTQTNTEILNGPLGNQSASSSTSQTSSTSTSQTNSNIFNLSQQLQQDNQSESTGGGFSGIGATVHAAMTEGGGNIITEELSTGGIGATVHAAMTEGGGNIEFSAMTQGAGASLLNNAGTGLLLSGPSVGASIAEGPGAITEQPQQSNAGAEGTYSGIGNIFSALGGATIGSNVPQNIQTVSHETAPGGDTEVTTDPPRQGFLPTAGISYSTPVILGSFEFMPPWKTAHRYEGSHLSSAGKLIDLQNILKQARNNSINEIFHNFFGVWPSSTGGEPLRVTAAAPQDVQNSVFDEANRLPSVRDTTSEELNQYLEIFLALEEISLSLNVKRNSNKYRQISNSTDLVSHFDRYDGFGVSIAQNTKALYSFFLETLKYSHDFWSTSTKTVLVMQLFADLRASILHSSLNLWNDTRTMPSHATTVAGYGGTKSKVRYEAHKSLGKIEFSGWDPAVSTSLSLSSQYFTQADANSVFNTPSTVTWINKASANLHYATRDYYLRLALSHGTVRSKSAQLGHLISPGSAGRVSSLVAAQKMSDVFDTIFGPIGGPESSQILNADRNSSSIFTAISPNVDVATPDPPGITRQMPLLSHDRQSLMPGVSQRFMGGKDWFVDSQLTSDDGERLSPARFTGYVDDISDKIDTLQEMILPVITAGHIANTTFFKKIIQRLKYFIEDKGELTVDRGQGLTESKLYQIGSLWMFMLANDNTYLFQLILKMIMYRKEYQQYSSSNRPATLVSKYNQAKQDLAESIWSHYSDREVNYDNKMIMTTTDAKRVGRTYLSRGLVSILAAPGERDNLYVLDADAPSGQRSLEGMIGTGTSSFKIWDMPLEAARKFQIEAEQDANVNLGSSDDPGTQKSDSKNFNTVTGDLGVGYYGRVAVAMKVMMEMLCDSLFVNFSSSTADVNASVGNDGGGGQGHQAYTYQAASFGYNFLNAIAFSEALDAWSDAGKTGDYSSQLKDSLRNRLDGEQLRVEPTSFSSDMASLRDDQVQEAISDALRVFSNMSDIKINLFNEDVHIFNILHYLQKIKDVLNTTSTSVQNSLDQTSGPYANTLTNLNTESGRFLCQNLTRDQLSLSGALYHSLLSPSREYPAFPAGKTIHSKQVLNMLSWMTQDVFSPDAIQVGGRPRIMTVGLPAGLLEYLRDASESQTGDSYYGDATTIKIVVHRQNLVSDSENPGPLVYYFDTANHIVEGIEGQDDMISLAPSDPSPYGTASMLNDANIRSFHILNKHDEVETKVLTPNPVDLGKYGTSTNLKDHIRNNHLSDHYLKIYLKTVMGIDIYEDVFQHDTASTLRSGPDSVSLGTSVAKEAIVANTSQTYEKAMTSALQNLSQFTVKTTEEAIEFSRLSSEIARSLPFSKQKYANRVLQAKKFDRVFCLLVHEQNPSFMSGDANDQTPTGVPVMMAEGAIRPITNQSNTSGDTSSSSNFGNTGSDSSEMWGVDDPSYYNFFVTVELAQKPLSLHR